jgi:peptidoglycan/LPS O-acetylase OafA/YrhL
MGSFRLFLALVVVLWHTSRVAPIKGAIATEMLYGIVAVCVFFVLSGYIITEAARTFYVGRPFAFLANRFVRLYPQYIAVLLIAGLVLTLPPAGAPLGAASLSPSNVIKNFFSITPFVTLLGERVDWISIVWALRVEFTFYALVCAGLLLSAWFPVLGRRSLLIVCASCLVGFFLLQIFSYSLLLGNVMFVPMFVAGVSHSFFGRSLERERAAWAAVTAMAVGLSALQLLTYAQGGTAHRSLADAWAAGFWMSGLLFLVLLAAGFWMRFSTPFDRRAGELSYLVYLVHQPLVMLLEKQQLHTIWNVLLVPALTLAVAALLAHFTELPLSRLRLRLRTGTAR